MGCLTLVPRICSMNSFPHRFRVPGPGSRVPPMVPGSWVPGERSWVSGLESRVLGPTFLVCPFLLVLTVGEVCYISNRKQLPNKSAI